MWACHEGAATEPRTSCLGELDIRSNAAVRREVPAAAPRIEPALRSAPGSRRSIGCEVRLIGDDGRGGGDCEPGPGCTDLQADDNKWTVPSRGREVRATAARCHARVAPTHVEGEEMSKIEMRMQSLEDDETATSV